MVFLRFELWIQQKHHKKYLAVLRYTVLERMSADDTTL